MGITIWDTWLLKKGKTVNDQGVTAASMKYTKLQKRWGAGPSQENTRALVGAATVLKAAIVDCRKGCKPAIHGDSIKMLDQMLKSVNNGIEVLTNMQRDYVGLLKIYQSGVANVMKGLEAFTSKPAKPTADAANAALDDMDARTAKLVRDSAFTPSDLANVTKALSVARQTIKAAGVTPDASQVATIEKVVKVLKGYSPPDAVTTTAKAAKVVSSS